MKKQILSLAILLVTLLLPFLWNGSGLVAQNIAITDDDSYIANPSAMLDVKSLTKGLLVPRLTSLQRLAIVSPATGLLVFDSTLKQFLYYNGTTWLNLLTPEGDTLWNVSANSVSLANPLWNMGVGSTNPVAKLEVKGDSLAGIDDPLFAVVNKNGDTIFAVYQGGVRIYVQDDPAKASGSKGGFAVGGFSPAKGALTNEYLRITPDSIRLYVEDLPATKASGSKGGFAVGGFSPAKAIPYNLFVLNGDSANVFIGDTTAGFGISGVQGGLSDRLLNLNKNNYFIGHQTGISLNSSELYNLFIGYQAGTSSWSGSNNSFIGYQAGLNCTGDQNILLGYRTGISTWGSYNTFIGNESGKTNNGGTYNVLIGHQSGYSNDMGSYNLMMGYQSGFNNDAGEHNLFLGYQAGYSNISGVKNILLGYQAGYSNLGHNNVLLGYLAGYDNISNYNVFIGTEAGTNNTSGTYNVHIGGKAGNNAWTGDNNIFMGYLSGGDCYTGSNNIFLGYSTGKLCSGSNNVFLGRLTGGGSAGSNNTFVGTYAGNQNDGNYNVFLGDSAGTLNMTGSYNVLIGHNAGYNSSGSNKLYIDNSSTASPLIYGDFSTDKVTINSVLKLTPIASAPTSPVEGEIYVNSTDHHIYCYLNGAWSQLD